MEEELRILTPAQFCESADKCLQRLNNIVEEHEGDPRMKAALIHIVRIFCIDLESTLFKED